MPIETTSHPPPQPESTSLISHFAGFIKHWLYSGFVVLTDFYGLSVSLLLLCKWLFGEQWWVVEMFNSLFPAILMPALVMFPGSLLIRKRRLLLFTVLPLLTFIIIYSPFFFPRSVEAPTDTTVFSLLTFNTHAETRPATLDAMAALIRTANADIVALQEFTQEAADQLSVALAELYPYSELYPIGRTVLGKGVFSKYPLLSSKISPSPDLPKRQRLEIEIAGQVVVLYNVHPTVPSWRFPYDATARQNDITDLLIITEPESGPLIIAGDFNMTDQANDYQRMTQRYQDTFHEVGLGLGLTFPDYGGFNPILAMAPQIIRLDYVFHNSALYSVEARAWPSSAGSDHRPVFVRLALASVKTEEKSSS